MQSFFYIQQKEVEIPFGHDEHSLQVSARLVEKSGSAQIRRLGDLVL
jgi:hypothetical protein